MKRIHILLSNADCLIMRFLKFFTGAEYNHASIDIEGDMKCFYTFGRRLRYFPVIGGFKSEEINMGAYSYLKNVTCAVYSLDIPEEAYERLSLMVADYVRNMRKYKYNFGAIAGYYINVPVYMKNRHTCSEFIAVLLSKSGICSFKAEYPLVIPAHLEEIPGLKLVYKGRMKDIFELYLPKGTRGQRDKGTGSLSLDPVNYAMTGDGSLSQFELLNYPSTYL